MPAPTQKAQGRRGCRGHGGGVTQAGTIRVVTADRTGELACSEETVACITKAWEDITLTVQLAI